MFEFNQHGATLDHNEIKHWLEFCLTLYIWAKKVTNEDWLMMMRFYENPGENGIETLSQGQSPEKDGIETFSQGQNPEQDGIETPSQEEQKPNDDHPDLCKFLHQIGVNPENAKYFLAKRDARCFGRSVRPTWVWDGMAWVKSVPKGLHTKTDGDLFREKPVDEWASTFKTWVSTYNIER
jgi:hypothetical protein